MFGCGAAPSVQAPTPAQVPVQAGTVEAPGRGPLYDLRQDEGLGGHTLARHVGRTDRQLAERLTREPGISAASTYTDEATARRVVALALEESHDRIDAWASRQGSRPNLAINYTQRGEPAIGRSLFRGEAAARPCDRALVVLRWLEREHRWIVLTSYPETRR
jgi:Bacterial CdiA-CT RNAse A domain